MMKLMLVASDVETAKEAQDAGVDRIFLDLEYINKIERQMGRNTLISTNTIENVADFRRVIDKSKLLVRVNPINSNSKAEIDRVIADGADIVMLPMALDAGDVKTFVDYVGGRAETIPMIETAPALARIDEILEVGGFNELFIGLNDLHISMNLTFMFELLSGGIVEYLAEKIKSNSVNFGFGGIAKIGEGILPAERILAEHYRLGSQSVILSRTFRNERDSKGPKVDFAAEVAKVRERESEYLKWSPEQFEENRLEVKKCVKKIVDKISQQ